MNRMVIAVIAAVATGCSSTAQRTETEPQVRSVEPGEVSAYHEKLELKVGWLPYENAEVISVDGNRWAVSIDDSSKKSGAIPVILIRQGDDGEPVQLGMDIDNALLGKLLKHSLMTEIPIKRPFEQFLKEADCAMCHPSSIKIKN